LDPEASTLTNTPPRTTSYNRMVVCLCEARPNFLSVFWIGEIITPAHYIYIRT